MNDRVIMITSNYEDGDAVKTDGKVILRNGKIIIETEYEGLRSDLEHGLPFDGRMVYPKKNPEEFFKAVLIEYSKGTSGGALELP